MTALVPVDRLPVPAVAEPRERMPLAGWVLMLSVWCLGVGVQVAAVLLVPLAPRLGAVALGLAVGLLMCWAMWERARRLWGV